MKKKIFFSNFFSVTVWCNTKGILEFWREFKAHWGSVKLLWGQIKVLKGNANCPQVTGSSKRLFKMFKSLILLSNMFLKCTDSQIELDYF